MWVHLRCKTDSEIFIADSYSLLYTTNQNINKTYKSLRANVQHSNHLKKKPSEYNLLNIINFDKFKAELIL